MINATTPELTAIASIQDWSEVYDLAETYRKQKQWQEAAIALQRVIQLRPDFFWSYHHLGGVLSKLQQWQGAVEAYSKAVKLDSEFFWSWHNLGDALSKLQQWSEAVEAYSKAVKLDSEFFWSWHNLGDALAKLEQWQEAIASYLRGIYLQPEQQFSYQKLGNAFKQQGNLDQTIQYYRQVIKEPPANSIFELLSTQPQRLNELVDTLIKQHQIYGAIVICYLALEIQPTHTDILMYLPQLLQQQNQLESAIAANQQKLDNHTTSSLLTQLKVKPEINPLSKPKVKPIPGRIVIKVNGAISLKQLNDLSLAVGWLSRPQNKFEQALKGSFRYIAAWHIYEEQQQLIAFARAVSDGVYQATLLDIAVHPDFQGRGVGKAMVKTLIEQLQTAQITDITLFSSPHIVDFYHKLGFVSQPNNLQWMLWSSPDQ